MKNLKVLALMQALGVGAYITLIAAFFQYASMFSGEDNFFSPILALLLFVLSAAITSSLVLGKVILMYLENKKTEAVKLFGYTLGWLFILTILALFLQIIF